MSDSPKPVYLLAGGREGARAQKGPDPLLREALSQAGVANPSVAYVGVASGDNVLFRVWISRLLKKAGAAEVRLAPMCGKRADLAKAERVLRAAEVVFVSGGDVDEGMKVLEEKQLGGLLRELHGAGKLFLGVSAGSILLGRSWVRWRDPKDDGSKELFPCLGLAPVLCDTHGERDGWEELKALASLAPAESVSYGITTRSALVVEPGGAVYALGKEVDRFTRKGRAVTQLESLRARSSCQLP
jgi:cyanophycinase